MQNGVNFIAFSARMHQNASAFKRARAMLEFANLFLFTAVIYEAAIYETKFQQIEEYFSITHSIHFWTKPNGHSTDDYVENSHN